MTPEQAEGFLAGFREAIAEGTSTATCLVCGQLGECPECVNA